MEREKRGGGGELCYSGIAMPLISDSLCIPSSRPGAVEILQHSTPLGQTEPE